MLGKRCSPAEWSGSSIVTSNESPNTVDASPKSTPCFPMFVRCFPWSLELQRLFLPIPFRLWNSSTTLRRPECLVHDACVLDPRATQSASQVAALASIQIGSGRFGLSPSPQLHR